MGETCTYRAHSRCGYPAVDFDIQNDTLLQGFDVAFATYDNLALNKDLNEWDGEWLSKWNQSFMTNSSSKYLHENITEGTFYEIVDDNTWEKCIGAPRNLWISVTRVEFTNLTMPAEGVSQQSKVPDFEMMFYNHRGSKQPAPPTPPSPPIPPPRPVPYDKDISVSEVKFADRDSNKTFIMTEEQLNQTMRFPLHPGTAASLNFKGTWQTDVGKTGIQLSLYDTIADKLFYKNEFYMGKANFTKGEALEKRINFLVPTYIPQSLYDVRVALINWIKPNEEYGALTCVMDVTDK